MRHHSNWNAFSAVLVALAVLVAPRGAALAKAAKPFKITGGGVAPEGLRPPGETTTHLIEGHATHLGKHSGIGTFDIDTFVPDDPFLPTSISGTFASADPCVFVAANGDQLVCYYGRTDKGASEIGTFKLTVVGVTEDLQLIVEALFIAEFVPQPELSTGRFAGTTGGWIMYATTEPFVLGSSDPVDYAWEGQGSLTFP